MSKNGFKKSLTDFDQLWNSNDKKDKYIRAKTIRSYLSSKTNNRLLDKRREKQNTIKSKSSPVLPVPSPLSTESLNRENIKEPLKVNIMKKYL